MDRFDGFADLYDANRPSAPVALGPLLARYAGVQPPDLPDVVDLGSGTGLSSRWAAKWAGSVVGVEPGDDMRAQANARPTERVTYRSGRSDATGLPDASADVVIAVQAMHWMEPMSTLAEVARLLRPGGVIATVDADWPPVTGLADAERAWDVVHRRMRVFEARAASGESVAEMRRPIDDDDPELTDDDLRDPHKNRKMTGGTKSWSKAQHLANIAASGSFRFVRELVFDQAIGDGEGVGSADLFIAVMRSQGSYQTLRKLGLDDEAMGAAAFERTVGDAFAAAGGQVPMSYSWRVRLGVTPRVI